MRLALKKLTMAAVLAGPLGLAIMGRHSPSFADSVPELGACDAPAAAYADRHAVAGADLSAGAIEGGIDGAVVGGLTGRRPGPDGWSPRGARRGARAGAAIGVLDALGTVDPAEWQALYDRAYEACLTGAPLPPPSRPEDCSSTTRVIEGARSRDRGGLYSAGSRLDGCR
ncbi:hypothetical protein GR183_12170 [Stappia sp. GBMRC 2046]|uniref:Uncharacterized protein n=1 Tax=Stappia sediminis TaxID=2692190 RepID=A0A7X3LV22_9HYPH|nr:hypothetical protein [Stappia sediminis]MXN65661.1 hypothetical protein [Stappia sediminis]